MATLFNKNHASMADLIKADNFDGDTKKLLGQMAEEDPLMASMPWFLTNDGVSHKDVRAEKLGTGSFIGANEGRTTTSSDTSVKTSNICLYSKISQVEDVLLSTDKKLAKKLRMQNHLLNVEGINQGFTGKVFYAESKNDPKGFNGLSARRSNLKMNTNKFDNKYIYDGGQTTGKSTSIYMIQFGESGVCMRHQEGTKSGLEIKDRGMKTYNIDGKIIDYWEMEYNIWSMLGIHDDRALLRYANINPEGTANGVNTDILIEMKNQLPRNGKSAGGYVNRSLITQIEILLSKQKNVYYSRTEIENFGPVNRFLEIPLFLQDCVKNNEARVI